MIMMRALHCPLPLLALTMLLQMRWCLRCQNQRLRKHR